MTDRRRHVLITGGSRGMGAATVRCFARRGWDVTFTFKSRAQAADGVRRAAMAEAADARVEIERLDLRSEQDILELFLRLDAREVRLDALVNNAAVTGPKTALLGLTSENLREVTETNWVGTVLMLREAVRRMSTAHGGSGGSIVNLSSTAVRLGAPGQWVHYAGLKGAIDVLTQGLAREVAEQGIRVNAVSPGYTLTDEARADEIVARFERHRHEVPMGRIGTVDEVAEAVHWLCSEAASYVTGVVLPVAGGR